MLKDQEPHQMQAQKVIKAIKKLKKPLNRQFPQKKNRHLALQILKVVSQSNLLKKLKNLNLKKFQQKNLLLHQMIPAQMIPINHQLNQRKLTIKKKFLLQIQMTKVMIPINQVILQVVLRKKLKKKKKNQQHNQLPLLKNLKQIQMIQILEN